MLSSISPLGERARGSRWWLTTTSYLVGSLAGGVVLGVLAGALGALVPSSWRGSWAAFALVAVALAVMLALEIGNRMPAWKRQVDVAWLARYRGWVYGGGFGAQLGFGLVTIVTSATTYAMVVLALLSGHPGAGVAIGGTFGLVRALPALGLVGVRTTTDLHELFARLERWSRPVALVAKVALAAVMVTFAAAAVAVGSG